MRIVEGFMVGFNYLPAIVSKRLLETSNATRQRRGHGEGMFRQSELERERIILETSVLLITLLFAIAQLGEAHQLLSPMSPSTLSYVSYVSFCFAGAAIAATLLLFFGSRFETIDNTLRVVELVFFLAGLGSLALVFYASQSTFYGVLPLGICSIVLVLYAIGVGIYQRRLRREGARPTK